MLGKSGPPRERVFWISVGFGVQGLPMRAVLKTRTKESMRIFKDF